jgi:tRNA-dihydrouridine synthase
MKRNTKFECVNTETNKVVGKRSSTRPYKACLLGKVTPEYFLNWKKSDIKYFEKQRDEYQATIEAGSPEEAVARGVQKIRTVLPSTARADWRSLRMAFDNNKWEQYLETVMKNLDELYAELEALENEDYTEHQSQQMEWHVKSWHGSRNLALKAQAAKHLEEYETQIVVLEDDNEQN